MCPRCGYGRRCPCCGHRLDPPYYWRHHRWDWQPPVLPYPQPRIVSDARAQANRAAAFLRG